MNCICLSQISADSSFPWFEESVESKKLCKVYHDGSHYVASLVSPKRPGRKCLKVKTEFDEAFDQLYLNALKINIPQKEIFSFLFDNLKEEYSGIESDKLKALINEGIKRKKHNLYVRKRRFRRKAFLNEWNYFVTFTYDDELHTEDSFRQSLRKCLSNLHTRRGWLYMGVFEHAPDTGRLHFHGLIYVPEGQMLSFIDEKRDYSTKQHKMVVTHPNRFFERRFGRNDFASITQSDLRSGSTLSYILKYLEKTDERIIYSRGIPTDFLKDIGEDDIASEMCELLGKYVLFDDVIDYWYDVMKLEKEFYIPIDDSSPPYFA